MGRLCSRRERLFEVLREQDIRNNVVLTGDIHSSWCNELSSNPWATSATANEARVVGVEFVGPAVSSPGQNDQAQAAIDAERIRSISPHIKYVERFKRGYGILDVTRERAQCEFYHLQTVSVPDKRQELAAVYASEAGAIRSSRLRLSRAARWLSRRRSKKFDQHALDLARIDRLREVSVEAGGLRLQLVVLGPQPVIAINSACRGTQPLPHRFRTVVSRRTGA